MKLLIRYSLLVFMLFLLSCRDSKWDKTFSVTKTDPFGTQLVYDHLDELFPQKEINLNAQKLFDNYRHARLGNIELESSEILYNNWYDNYSGSTNTIEQQNLYTTNWAFIGYNKFDEQDVYALVHEIIEGRTIIFTSSEEIRKPWDSIVGNTIQSVFDLETSFHETDSTTIELLLGDDSFTINHIEKYTSINSNFEQEALVQSAEGNTVITRYIIGKGQLIFCTEPLLFTNLNLLTQQNRKLIEYCFNFFDDNDVTWFQNYSSDNYTPEQSNVNAKTPSYLEFINANPALKAAYYLLLLGGFIYAVLGIKRKQRFIPIMNSPQNTTVKFVTMIGQLYRDNGSHDELANKKILFFAEWLKDRFHFQGDVFTLDIFSLVAERSRVKKELLFDLLRLIESINSTDLIDKNTLLELNKQIELLKKIL